MKPYRFSPIKNKEQLFKVIEYIHLQGHKLCRQKLGYALPVAGNIGVFCHYNDEFKYLTDLRKQLTDTNINWNQKYFRLYQPIVIPAKGQLPETIYKYLYIRHPDNKTPEVGDVDFYLKPDKYKKLKRSVLSGKFGQGVEIFDRPDLDMIKLCDSSIDVTAFIGSYDLDKITTIK